jgi:hypothetical protein
MIEILVKYGESYQPLDLNGDELFEINYSINDIKDISITKGSSSKTIVIPDTKLNRTIFGFVTDLGSDLSQNNFNPNKKMPAYVVENGRTILTGSVQLLRYIINDNYNNIEIVVSGGNTSFFNSMGDKLLTDIDWSEYDFKLTKENIIASWNNSTDSHKRGYYFPLIDYGKGWTLDDVNGRRRLGSTSTIGSTLRVRDFLPAVYYKTIWDKIHWTNNYSIESNFIGYENIDPDPRFGSLVIPFSETSLITDSLFNQNKIFNVGLSQSTLGQYSTFSIGTYVAKNRTPASLTYSNVIVNADGSAAFSGGRDGQKNLWYNGYLLQPWEGAPQQNTFGNDTYAGFIYTSAIIPFSKDTEPLYNTYNDNIATYNTTNYWYKNNTDDVFKQRFALQTDVVALWSQNMITQHFGAVKSKNPSEQSFRYVLNVKFYRSINPVTGVTATGWLSGTGYQIPADLSLGGIAKNIDGSISTLSHWICDRDAKSNCVTDKGDKIVPEATIDDAKYIGEFCTDPLGLTALTPDNTTSFYNYDYDSGSCLGWFYNSGINQTTDRLKGLWASGVSPEGYGYPTQATYQPFYSDWYQDLLLQTIYLDGDEFDTRYGASGSLLVNGNKPIQPGEMVRCVVEFGGKYPGQYITGTETSYKPPSACYLLTETNLANYIRDGVNINGTYSNPKTRFFNDVSNEYITGQTIKFADIIPKNVKQSDFIKDGIMMHNIYVEPKKEDSSILIEEPRDMYYGLESDVLDWSNKVDYNQPINIQVLAETQYKRTVFTYKEDSDYYNQLYKKNTNEIYGQFIGTIDNDFLVGELKMTSLFSPTPLSTLYNYSITGIPIIRSGGIVLPVLLNSDLKVSNNELYNVNYRLLQRKYITIKNSDRLKIFDTFYDTYPYAGPYDNPYIPNYSINFGQTLGEFYPVPTDQFYDNLVNTYWASILSEMNDIDSRFLSVYMALDEKDIEDFKFNKLVYLTINNVSGYYKVNSIENYYPGERRTCLVTLLKTNSNLPTKIYSGSTSTPRPTSVVLISGGGGSIPIPGPDASS